MGQWSQTGPCTVVLHHFGLCRTIGFQAGVSDTSGVKHPESSHQLIVRSRCLRRIVLWVPGELPVSYVLLLTGNLPLYLTYLILPKYYIKSTKTLPVRSKFCGRESQSLFKLIFPNVEEISLVSESSSPEIATHLLHGSETIMMFPVDL